LWNKLISNVLKYHNFKVKGASLDKIEDAYHQAEKDLIKYNQFLKKQGKKYFQLIKIVDTLTTNLLNILLIKL